MVMLNSVLLIKLLNYGLSQFCGSRLQHEIQLTIHYM